jgi:hypothetical protein
MEVLESDFSFIKQSPNITHITLGDVSGCGGSREMEALMQM